MKATRNLPPDWWVLTEGAAAQREALEAEARREIGPGHPLSGLAVRAVAKHRPDDDVLFMLPDGRPAVVHLTWRMRKEIGPRWPSARIFESWEHCLADLWDGYRLGNP